MDIEEELLIKKAWKCLEGGYLMKALDLHLVNGGGISIFRFEKNRQKKTNCELFHIAKESYFWDTIIKNEPAFVTHYDPTDHFCVGIQIPTSENSYLECIRVYNQFPFEIVYESHIF